jgi:hypothetical protein
MATVTTFRQPGGPGRLDGRVIAELCPRHNRRPRTYDRQLARQRLREGAPYASGSYATNVQAPLKASVRDFAQLPYRSVTVDDAGHSPACSRLSASPPRWRAWVRDQS